MIRVAAVACLGLLVVPSVALGRQGSLDSGRWKSFTAMRTVTGVVASRESIWVATTGGLFLYTPSTNRYTKFTNSEGLSSNNLTAVALDGAGRVWVGAFDGSISIYDVETRQWREIRSIKDSDRIQKAIRTFLVRGDSLFVGTDFGISVLSRSRMEFGDTYATFGFPTQAGINEILIHQNRIWAATDLGVVSAPLEGVNLSSPTAWRRYETVDGLPAKDASSIAIYRDTIIAGTSNGLAFFNGAAFQPLGLTSGKIVVRMLARADDLLVLWNDAQSYSVVALSHILGPLDVIASNERALGTDMALEFTAAGFWVGTAVTGLAQWTDTGWNYLSPNGPGSNLFSSVVVDDRGVLWAASGISGRGQGFYRYDPSAPEGEQWKNFAGAGYPIMGRGPNDPVKDDYYKVSLGGNGSVWVSSWGRGVLEVVGDSISRRLDDASQPALAGSVTHDQSYVVAGGVAADSKGNTWIVNRTAVNGNHLAELGSDNSTRYRSSPSSGIFTNIAIDRNNTKWLACAEPWNAPAEGLYYFNEDTLVSGTAFTGGWGRMTDADGLPSNVILSLAVDLDGDVCIGTDLGMRIIIDPLNPRAALSRVVVLPLLGQTVQAIAVDGVNNKWAGTKEGVIVVTPDGVQLLAQYSVLSTNGRLVDNDIRSIAIDQKQGIAYFGTENGLSSLEIAPIQTERALTSLEIGPNPFLIPSNQQLTITKLVPESSVRILTVNGSLVTEFQAQGGGRAFWDGRDREGGLVPSGVYFVIVHAEDGNQVATGKVAVVRR